MKKNVIFFLCLFLVVLSSNAQKTPVKAPAQPQKISVSKAEIEEGKQLISKSDCFACHKLNEKAVGPSYVDVAKKYPLTTANVSKLADKVIKGGSGAWGQIPMAPHANISVEDSKKIVKYILSSNTK